MPVVDAEVIFYLASTIAQVLAALAGFLGAFVLFQRQGIEGRIDAFHASFQWRGLGDEFVVAATEGDSPALLAALEGYERRDLDRYNRDVRHLLAKYQTLLGQRRGWLPPFRDAMFVTAPVLLTTLAAILWAKSLAHCTSVAICLCAVLIAGAAVCAGLYWRVVARGFAGVGVPGNSDTG